MKRKLKLLSVIYYKGNQVFSRRLQKKKCYQTVFTFDLHLSSFRYSPLQFFDKVVSFPASGNLHANSSANQRVL